MQPGCDLGRWQQQRAYTLDDPRPRGLDRPYAIGHLPRRHVLQPRLLHGRLLDRRYGLQRPDPRLVSLGAQPRGRPGLRIDDRHVQPQHDLVQRAARDRPQPDLDPVGERRLPVEPVALHLPLVAEVVAGARRGPRRLVRLHRQSAQQQSLRETADRVDVTRRAPRRVAQRVPQRRLHEVPDRAVDRLDPELVGDHPVGAGGHLLDEVAVPGRRQPPGGRGHDVQRSQHEGRRRAGTRDLEPVARDRGSERRVPVHRCRRRHDPVRASQLAGRQLRDVVERSRADDEDHGVGGGRVLAEPYDVAVVRVQGRRAREHVRVEHLDPGADQGRHHGGSRNPPRVLVRHHERGDVTEHVDEQSSCLGDRVPAHQGGSGVCGCRQCLVDRGHGVSLLGRVESILSCAPRHD